MDIAAQRTLVLPGLGNKWNHLRSEHSTRGWQIESDGNVVVVERPGDPGHPLGRSVLRFGQGTRSVRAMGQSRGLIVHVKTHHDNNLCTMRPSPRQERTAGADTRDARFDQRIAANTSGPMVGPAAVPCGGGACAVQAVIAVNAMTAPPNAPRRSCTFAFSGENHFAPLMELLRGPTGEKGLGRSLSPPA
jgi:hypothetical protein